MSTTRETLATTESSRLRLVYLTYFTVLDGVQVRTAMLYLLIGWRANDKWCNSDSDAFLSWPHLLALQL